MSEPIKENYGWCDKNTFDGEEGGWMFEGGEESYYEALKDWKEVKDDSANKNV